VWADYRDAPLVLQHREKQEIENMTTNEGTVDRTIRLVLGVALIVVALFGGFGFFDGAVAKYTTVLVGLVLAITGLVGTCPAYSIFGIRTCKP
jgi:hypothetical protein